MIVALSTYRWVTLVMNTAQTFALFAVLVLLVIMWQRRGH